MTEHKHPPTIDIRSAVHAQARLEGVALLSNFERLAQTQQDSGGDFTVSWVARWSQRAAADGTPATWLNLQVETTLVQICQRCLLPVDVAVQIDRDFRFVESEAVAAQQDDGCEEDLLVLSRAFDLAGLIEDEVLMDLPLVPRHAVCPVPVKLSVVDANFDASGSRPNPFAALSQLKSKR